LYTTGHATDGLTYWAAATPDRLAIVFDGHDAVDYATLDRWTDNAAALLASRGVSAGDRVAIVGANSLQWCAAGIGVLKLGAVVVPFNNRFTVSELSHLIDDSEPVVALTDDATRGRMAQALSSTGKLYSLDEFTELRNAPHQPLAEQPKRDASSVAMIVYTSGSTAAPKGVIYTHQTILGFISELAITEPVLRPGARMIYVLSMSGAPGLPWHVLQPLTRGMTIYYEKGFDAGAVLERLSTARIEMMSGVPLMFEQIAALPEFAGADLSSLGLCTIAGARVPLPTLRAWLDKGVLLRQAYGMTELGGLSSINPVDQAETRPQSIGRGSIFTRSRVVRSDGNDCTAGEPGEIIVSGPAVTPGYWRNAEATVMAIRDGWLHTGDVGVVDVDGYIQVVDRIKDLIISGGFNISPSEIEATINDLPGVLEVCVIAAASPKFGETPAAVVYPGATVLTPADVVAWCETRLAPYKVPHHVIIEKEPLPRMSSGKLARRVLRDLYGDIAETHPQVR
jgi:fatty-acyl-CoA synthase